MRQVLIVEDELLVAMELESGLRRAGFSIQGPCFSVRHALRAIAEQPPDLAIVDIDVNGVKSQSVAEALLAARVPFVTLTGYSEREIPPIYRTSQIVIKPYDMQSILRALDCLDRPTIGYTL